VQDMFRWTALMCAAAAGKESVVRYLVQYGANLDHTDGSGRRAVDLARMNRHQSVVDALEDYKRDFDSRPQHPMAHSATERHCEVCQTKTSDPGHETSILHVVNSRKQPAEGYAYGIPQSNRGYRLLKESGWAEHRGLGKKSEGRKYPIKTSLKRDRTGLGLEKTVQKVTHFESYDPSAVQSVPKAGRRRHVKELEKQKRSDKRKEEKIREMLR
ncbi:G-patch domain-containing protein, partial [Aphelenchoides avenae]